MSDHAALPHLGLPVGWLAEPVASAPERVLVALSGGVDSSVAAALLVEAGHEVVGVWMRLHDAADRVDGGRRRPGPRRPPQQSSG